MPNNLSSVTLPTTNRFAIPFGHHISPSGNFNFYIGKTFFQPVNISSITNFSDGIEVWLDGGSNDHLVFSVLNGIIQYDPSSETVFLEIDWNSRLNLFNIFNPGPLEPAPKVIIYEGIKQDSFQSAIETLINDAYNDALNNHPNDESQWHPLLKTFLDLANDDLTDSLGDNVTTEDKGVFTLKGLFDKASNDWENTSLSDAVNYITYLIAYESEKLPVISGDFLGKSATSNKSKPTNFSTNDPRLTTIKFKDYSHRFIDPKYFIWWLLKDAFDHNYLDTNGFITLNGITDVHFQTLPNHNLGFQQNNKVFSHPFLNSNGLNIDLNYSQVPLPRKLDSGNLYFPLDYLSDWRGYTENHSESDLQWRINNESSSNNFLNFEVRRRDSDTYNNITTCGETEQPSYIDVCPNPKSDHHSQVSEIWNNFGTDINDICVTMQFPVEYIVALIGKESWGYGDERALRLEPLSDEQKSDLNNNSNTMNLVEKYDNLTLHPPDGNQDTDQPEGYSLYGGVPEN
jgi:hypothetical protein